MSEATRPFLTAQWRNLVILTYAVDPARIIDLVPTGTTLDWYHSQAFVSLLAFQFLDTKVLGTSVPFHQDFEEVNLRFYVRRWSEEGVRHGVVFIREFVPRHFVGGMARLLYREPYQVVPMRSNVSPGPPPDVQYQWNITGHWCTLAASGAGPGSEAAPGSLEEFLTVRDWGYNGEKGKDTIEYHVEHPRWNIWHAENPRVDYDAEALCGFELAQQLKRPVSALIADGSAVSIYWRNRIAA